MLNFSGNAVRTNISAPITATATTVDIDDATGWPTENFPVALDRGRSTFEKVLVTSRSLNTLTIQRGYDDTTAQAHDAGASAVHVLTSNMVEWLRDRKLDTLSDVAVAAPSVGQSLVWDAPTLTWVPGGRTVLKPTDSIASIQEAINAGPVWFKAGTYDISTTLTVPSGGDIDGSTSAVLRRPDGSNGTILDASGANNVRIAGVTLDGNKIGQTTQATPLRVAGTDVLVHSLKVQNSSGYGILINGPSSRVTVRNCTVIAPDLSGITLNGDATNTVSRVLIEGCHTSGTVSHGLHNLGIASRVTYANNLITDPGGDGVAAYNAGNRHQLVTDNTILNTGGHFVHTGGNHSEISNNFGLTSAVHGWFQRNHDGSASYDCVISDNTAEGVTSRTLHVDNLHNSAISGNVVRGGGTHAVEMVLCSLISFNGNLVTASSNDGVVIMGCTRISVTGCTVHSNTRYGIYMRQEPGTVTESSDIVVSGNMVRDNGNTGVISVQGTDRACVTGNIVRGNTTAQISLVGVNNVNANNITA